MEIGDTYTSTPKTSGIGGLWICDWRDKARIDYFTNGYNTHVKAVRG
jgi:hypothetical protein